MCEGTEEDWDRWELGLALRLLNCPFMEKRLKGLSEIKKIVEWVTSKELAVRRHYPSLNAESLARWIVQSNVLEIVMENSHEELVKRLSTLIVFLADLKKLNTEHLDMLWRYTQGRHDSLLIAVYQVIIDIAPHLSLVHQRYFFEKIREVSVEAYDEKFLKMVKEYSIITINMEKQEMFVIPVLYDMILDSCKVKLHDLAIECLVEILKNTRDYDILWGHLEKAIGNIANNESICQSMMLIQKIMQNAIAASSLRMRGDLYKKIESQSQGIIRMVTGSFEALLHPERKTVYTATKNIKIRLKFWKFAVRIQFFQVKIDDIVDLWTVLKEKEFPVKAQVKFSKTLLKLIKSHFPANTNSEILGKLYLNSEFSAEKMSIESFDVFYELFLRVNYECKNIELKNNTLHSRIRVKLLSYECLVRIIFNSSDASILDKSSKLFISLNIKLGRQISSMQEEIWGEFLTVIQQYLTSSRDSEKIHRALTLVMQFLDNSHRKDEETSLPNCTVAYKQAGETELHKLFANYNITTLGAIRRRIADDYKKPVSSLILISNTTSDRYDALYDDYLLSTLKAPFLFIVEFQLRQKSLSPHEFFSGSQSFQESLLETLPMLTEANAEQAWTILSKVPLLEKYLSRFRTFSVPLSEMFSQISLYRLVYNLKIIEALTRNPKWLEDFIARTGIEKLLEVFLSSQFESDSAALVLEYNTYMISLISDMTKYQFQISETLIVKILDSLVQAAVSCQEDESSGDIAKNAKDIINAIRSRNAELYLSAVKAYPIRALLLASFVNCSCKYFSSMMLAFLLEQSHQIRELTSFFLQGMLGIFDIALVQTKGESYWIMLSFFISECEVTPELQQIYLGFFGVLENMAAEVSGKDHNPILSGIIKVLKTVIVKIGVGITEETVNLVLHRCLFEIPTKESRDAPKCKNSMTRKDAFELLKEMCRQSGSALEQVLRHLSSQYQDPHWRSSRYSDWNYHPRAHEKSSTGYVGVKNPGCICYMISSLQQLFFVQNFRETILRIEKPEEDPEESLLYQLQSLYSALKNSDKQHVNARGLCKTFKDWEGRPVNVTEQMDADEFINTFMDRIETQIKGDPGQDIIKELFTGLQATELIGKNSCTHRSEVNEAFITLPVQVKNKKTLLESLESYKEGEILEGSNAYQCDHCETKVTALRRMCIKYLPNILLITLGRFEYDYDKMKRVKVNDYCEFPMEINMEAFTQEGIERQELSKEKELCIRTGQEFSKEVPAKKYPEDYYQFRLRGVVIHAGTAESGHYYSFIRENNRWYEFNDTVVRHMDPSEIPNEAFGGEEKFTYQTQAGVSSAGFKSKLRNAYILIYERSTLYSYHKEEEVIRPMRYTHQRPEKEFLEVKEENERYWRCKSGFGSEYFDFILAMLEEKKDSVCRFGIAFFLTVMVRSRDNFRIVACVSSIKEQLKDNKETSEWILEMVSYKHVLKELLMDCPSQEKRRIIVGLVHCAMKNVAISSLNAFMSRILSHLDLAQRPHSYNFAQYFELIYRALRLYTGLISGHSISQKLVGYLRGNLLPSTDPESPYKFDDIYLGYDKYTPPKEKGELSVSDTGASLVFVINSLQLCVVHLQNEEVDYFFEESTMNLLLNEAVTRYSGKVIGQFYATLCMNNKQLTMRYGRFLIVGIDKSDYNRHAPYMRQLFWLLANSDTIVVEKLEVLMNLYLVQINNNKKYPMATESSVDFLIKVVAKIAAVKEWMGKHAKEYRALETVLGEPTVRAPGKAKEPYTPKNPLARIEALRKILRGQFNEKEWDDSESEFLEENASQGSRVEVFDFEKDRWVVCTVSVSIGEMLLVKSESEGISRWVDSLSDTIKAPGKRRNGS